MRFLGMPVAGLNIHEEFHRGVKKQAPKRLFVEGIKPKSLAELLRLLTVFEPQWAWSDAR